MEMIIAKAVIFLLLTYALGCFFYFMGKSKVIENSVKDIYARVDTASHTNTRERKKNIDRWEPQSGWEKLIEKPRRRLLYSGLQNRFPGLTIEIWLVLKLLTAAAVYFLSFILTQRLKDALPAMVIYIILLNAMESVLAVMNYNAVGSRLIEFLNMTSNYLETSGEITEAFGKVAKYMPEPLRSALTDCYHEARTSGDSHGALLTLADSIEHPTFKDVILNIEMSMQYSANYRDIIASCRKYVIDERQEQQERALVVYDTVTTMILLSISSVVCLFLMNKILTASIWDILMSPYGKAGLLIIGFSYVFILWRIFTDREVR